MPRKISIAILSFGLFIVSGWSQNSAVKEFGFSKDSLIQRIKTLSSDAYQGRRTETEGSKKAQKFIVSKFKMLGVTPLTDGFKQPFSFKRKEADVNGVNILGLIKGTEHPDKYIVISAHYDHLGVKDGKIFNGADDDASGTCALFSFAEYLKKNPPKHSVILAAFDAEEMGLRGARHYVENTIVKKENIVTNINMDMIGRNDNNELYVVGTRYYEQLKPAVTATQLYANAIKLSIGHDGSDKKQNWTGSSDHGAFHGKKIPFLYFGVEDHKDYHKATDDFEYIQPDFYANAVQTIIYVFTGIDKIK